jgi:site-specific recombinase XerD
MIQTSRVSMNEQLIAIFIRGEAQDMVWVGHNVRRCSNFYVTNGLVYRNRSSERIRKSQVFISNYERLLSLEWS